MNIGVVLHDLSNGGVTARFARRLDRLRLLDEDVDVEAFSLLLKLVRPSLTDVSKDPGFLTSLSQKTRGLLIFSDVKAGMADTIAGKLNSLFDEFVKIDRRKDLVMMHEVVEIVSGSDPVAIPLGGWSDHAEIRSDPVIVRPMGTMNPLNLKSVK